MAYGICLRYIERGCVDVVATTTWDLPGGCTVGVLTRPLFSLCFNVFHYAHPTPIPKVICVRDWVELMMMGGSLKEFYITISCYSDSFPSVECYLLASV